ncbi:MAG TPA: plastocyanin/azurin family copper-binding protein [Chitinophagaceae bacterium]|nr:plastocyanin/azurin family copper-binding protein [Chitinophagaceae bacterium]
MLLLRTISGFALFCLVQGCAPGAAKKAPQTHTVEIKGMQFQPASLIVQKNDTVVFVNHDLVAHNATEAATRAWQSPALAGGASWKVVVTQSAAYYCTLHPVMKGTLVVP